MKEDEILDLIEKEGDSLEWIYTTKSGVDYKCLISRDSTLKHLCGYVIIDDDDEIDRNDYNNIPVRVHGGITYLDEYEGEWIVGFDCAHHGDYIQGLFGSKKGVYRDMEFVKSECESLADQISELSLSKIRKIKLGKLL